MFEDMMEVLFSPLGLLYLSFFPAGRRLIKRSAKFIINASCELSDELRDLVAEVKTEIACSRLIKAAESEQKRLRTLVEEGIESESPLEEEAELKQPAYRS